MNKNKAKIQAIPKEESWKNSIGISLSEILEGRGEMDEKEVFDALTQQFNSQKNEED